MGERGQKKHERSCSSGDRCGVSLAGDCSYSRPWSLPTLCHCAWLWRVEGRLQSLLQALAKNGKNLVLVFPNSCFPFLGGEVGWFSLWR